MAFLSKKYSLDKAIGCRSWMLNKCILPATFLLAVSMCKDNQCLNCKL